VGLMAWRARLTMAIHEIRLVYCPQSASSKGMRDFIQKEYPDLKTLNPALPIYVRPSENASPFIAVRYDRGVYQKRSTADLSPAQISTSLKELSELSSQITASQSQKEASGGGAFKPAYIV